LSAPSAGTGRGVAALIGLAAVVALATLVVVPVDGGASGADSEERAETRVAGVGPQGRRAQFVVKCAYSHTAFDDPIVHRGQPGQSHSHDFFGSTIVDAHSTPDDLLAGPTTCDQRLDTASYWTPSLYHDGEQVIPTGSVAYYRPAAESDPADIVAHPAGLVVVAGDATATEAQPRHVVAWHCGSSPDLHTEPPTCTPLAPLTARIAFPSCWDGERLDAEDHASHMAYAEQGRCPASHPVAVPELVFEVEYPFHGDPTGLMLASGGPSTLHADFMNAWDQDKLEREVRVCLRAGRVCGVVSNRATG